MASEYEVHIAGISAGGPVPPELIDRFAPKYIVGNVPAGDSNVAHNAGGFWYYPDPGDGSGIALALTQPNGPGDVWVRPGNYDLNAGAVAAPLAVPAGVRLWGSGQGTTTILSKTAAATQEVLTLDAGAEVAFLKVSSPASVGAPAVGTSKGVITAKGLSARVRSIWLTLAGVTRTQPWGISDPSSTISVLDSQLDGADQDNANATGPSIAVALGPDPVTTPNGVAASSDYAVRGCQFTGWNQMVLAYNSANGDLTALRGTGIARPVGGAILVLFGGAPGGGFLSATGPRISNIRIEVAATEVGGDSVYTGVQISQGITGFNLYLFCLDDIQILFLSSTPTVPRTGYALLLSGNTNSVMESAALVACRVNGHSIGIHLRAIPSVGAAFMNEISLTSCMVKNPITIGAQPGTGIRLTTTGGGALTGLMIQGSSASGAPVTGFGLQIATAGCLNTIVTGNYLVPGGGTALSDAGTLTSSANNVLA